VRRLFWLAAALLPGFALSAACTGGDTGEGGHSMDGTADVGPGGSLGNGGSSAKGGASGIGGSGGELPDAGGDASDGATFDCNVLGEPGHCDMTTSCSAMSSHAPWPGFCPGTPGDVECCIPDLLLLCDPSLFATPNRQLTTEAPGSGGCPAGMLAVTTFCIDKYEASLVRMSDGTSWSPFVNPGTTEVVAVSVKDAVPQAYIDQVQAGDACTNAGKRLCSDTEWLRACQGPDAFTYPYGNTRMPGVCNDHRDLHPAYEYFGTTDDSVFTMLDNACIDQIPESLDKAGANSGCESAEGAFDMMGNIHEWTSNAAGSFRGGYYVDTVENGNGCLYVTTAHDTSYWDYSTGFRCCADP
jgi:sulfatase modifying factor 1